jgi:hypothetical protein
MRRSHHIQEHIFQIGLADLDVLGLQAGARMAARYCSTSAHRARAIARCGP